MRIFLLVIFFMAMSVKPVSAILPVTPENIAAAQEYGRQKSLLALPEFFHSWMVYEETAARLNDTTEWACLYTPFLLVASDARDKTLKRQFVGISDGKVVLEQYNRYLVFGVRLFGSGFGFADGVEAALKQGEKKVSALAVYSVTQNDGVLTTNDGVSVKLYIYIAKDAIDVTKPAVLELVTKTGRESKFFFNLSMFK
ncbi:MAG: hypothetical protein H6Q73_490 [Firmicutes bacterium]|nr:hypothetical protein [Bacillota bacterium]